jgi:hypothetical protein
MPVQEQDMCCAVTRVRHRAMHNRRTGSPAHRLTVHYPLHGRSFMIVRLEGL